MVVLSCVPYVGGLGLYSDDWTLLSVLHEAPGSFVGRVAAMLPIEMRTRPMQAVELAALYSLFGLEPLGYHIVNSLVLTAIVVLFHLSLRALGVPRVMAVAVPLIFGVLPHYSTDRVWIAAFQANASVFLYFLSLYADLRFVNGTGGRVWLWKLLGGIALVGSVLAYEVTAALFLINVLVLWYLVGRRSLGRPPLPVVLAIATNLAALALAFVYKLSTTVRADIGGGYGYRIGRIIKEAAPVHFGEYGLGLAPKVVRILSGAPSALLLGVSVAIGTLVLAYLLRVVRAPDRQFERGGRWALAVLAGLILFAAGYGVSLTTYEIGFHPTGPNNRTAIAAAIGVAWVLAGAVGWISSWLPSERVRWTVFSALVALLAASGTLLMGTVASFWIRASQEQQAVIAQIRARFPDLPPRTVLLLDGLCPFEGPAPVFATNWDTSGMLRLAYDDASLQGDVVKPNTELTPQGVRTMLFDDVINVYAYGDRVLVYHLGTSGVYPLTTPDAARAYFEDVSANARPACPPYTDGDGAEVF